ncbi:hypothetical protein HZH68_009757 [Vespula germanica]|uniref:Uncharacterized protein n=1 Tax=Vespula germanica TaxID=30212 RepID=A0A834JWH1_VESGE|nr:hypothetical protein HZH68_009757 [Vespula germanica]
MEQEWADQRSLMLTTGRHKRIGGTVPCANGWIIKLKYGVLAERCATRKNSAAEIRKRKFREEVKLERATRATRSSLKTGSRRGQGHRGTSTGVTGQALIEKNNRVEE